MAEVEDEEKSMRDWARALLPRILRALIWGFIMGGEMLIPLYLSGMGGRFLTALPVDQTGFSYFLFIFVGFEVAIQLLHGTILQYALSMTRSLISMVLLVVITDGGVLSMTLQSSPQLPLPPEMGIVFSIDFKAVLSIFLLLSLLSIIKNLLQAVEFLAEKEEEPVIPPEYP